MSRDKHTPGPWFVLEDATVKSMNVAIIGTKRNIGPACDPLAYVSVGAESGMANADLMAAAPELLAIVRGVLDGTLWCTCGSVAPEIPCPLCAPAEAAVAKAEGRAS